MPRKKTPPVEAESLPDFADTSSGGQATLYAESRKNGVLQDKLNAACEVMEAQARLLECYELRTPRIRAMSRLADARKAWEAVNE